MPSGTTKATLSEQATASVPAPPQPKPDIVYVRAMKTVASPALTLSAGKKATLTRAIAQPLINCGALQEFATEAEFAKAPNDLIH